MCEVHVLEQMTDVCEEEKGGDEWKSEPPGAFYQYVRASMLCGHFDVDNMMAATSGSNNEM
jgi:hypothetical protein